METKEDLEEVPTRWVVFNFSNKTAPLLTKEMAISINTEMTLGLMLNVDLISL